MNEKHNLPPFTNNAYPSLLKMLQASKLQNTIDAAGMRNL